MNTISEDKRKSKTNKAVCVAAFLLVSAALYLLAGIFFGFYIPCPFRAVTGFKCPGCGMSHAATHVALAVKDLIGSDAAGARSQVMEAFRSNALFIPIFAYIAYAFVNVFKSSDTGQSVISRVIDTSFLAVLLVWWVVRNIYGM